MTAIAHTHEAHQSVKQSLVNSTASASNASSGPSTFHSILSALGLSGRADSPSPIPSATASTGKAKPSGHSVLTANAQKALGHKGLKGLKVLTPDQAAQLAAQAQTPQVQAQAAQAALASSLASNPQPASSGWSVNSTISSVESAIKGGISDVIDALGGGSSKSSAPVAPPLAAPIVAAGGNVAQSKAQAQAAANTATSANSEALDVTLAQAMSLNSAQDPNAADSAMDASALQGARITAAKNPTSDQMAASKQQAFADLKPAADVKATEAQTLAPDAGLSKADSKDTDAKGGDGGSANDKPQDNAQSSSSAAPASQPSDPQQIVQPASQDASFATQVANNATVNAAAATAAGTPNHSAIAAPAANVALAPTADQSAAMRLDTGSLAISIAAKSIEGAKQFDIRLDPPELGRVDVKLSMDSTGKAQAHLSVEKPATLDMLQKDSGSLQRSLKESGVNLSNNGLQFSLKNQQQSGAALQQTRGRPLNINVVPVTAPVSTHGYAHGHARLDIRV